MKFFQSESLEKRQTPGLPQAGPRVQVVDGEVVNETTPPHAEAPRVTQPQPQPQPETPPRAERENAKTPEWQKTLATSAPWGLAVALIIVIIILWIRSGDSGTPASPSSASVATTANTFTVVAGMEPTEPIVVPLGSGLRWQSTDPNSKFEVITENGDKVAFPADSYKKLPDGRIIRFRSLEAKPVSIQVRIVPLP